ncbi:recombinase family protein [Sutcliffiella horikoshii]|uniref:Recombinase family protein n=1 Tax=Sutcliffiella horikoshii TaxID=79883 RepID=A0A5D4TAZ3_9BACI|nr:recombinase family protein [Sutcliffiella horikoshii]TYS72375.1 recombinase family protein [Sutcliffiella horikoshii]
MKCAIYIRVSTQDQVENYSIVTQRERLEAFCKSKGWEDYKVYVDPGYSGSNLDRPALKDLLSDINEYDVVLVYKLDRLSRSQRDTLTLIEEYFLKNNVDFVSITETLDTSTPFGKAMIGILSVFAQLERETIAERMRFGHIKRAENGLRGNGGNHDPSGYARVDGELVIKEDEAKHIQLVFNLYEQTHSITKVQERLKVLGEPVWRFRRYRDILCNKLYIGYVLFSGEYYKGQHDSIISKEQFNRVQIILSRHKGKNSNKAKESLFSGLITCSKCGENYHTYQTKDKLKNGKFNVYRYYVCRARRFPSEYNQKCTNHNWNYKKLEELINHEINSLILDKQIIENKTEQIDFESLIKKVDAKIRRILPLYVEGKIEKEVLDSQITLLTVEKNSLMEKKLNQEKQTPTTITNEELKQYYVDLLAADFKTRQSIIHKLINQIFIDGENIKVEWNF